MYRYHWAHGDYYTWTWDSLLQGSLLGLIGGLVAGWCLVDAWLWFESCRRPAAPPAEYRRRLYQLVICGCGLLGSLVGALTLGFIHVYWVTWSSCF